MAKGTRNNAKPFFIVALGIATQLICSLTALAATQTMTANVAFDVPLTLVKNSDINFGVVTANQANTYKIDTTGAVTVTGGAGTGLWLGGTHNAGNVTIKGSSTQTIGINANNYVVNNSVTPSAATCAYNGGGEVACTTLSSGQTAPTAAGKTLLLGVSVTANGTQNAGTTAAPTFDVVVSYA